MKGLHNYFLPGLRVCQLRPSLRYCVVSVFTGVTTAADMFDQFRHLSGAHHFYLVLATQHRWSNPQLVLIVQFPFPLLKLGLYPQLMVCPHGRLGHGDFSHSIVGMQIGRQLERQIATRTGLRTETTSPPAKDGWDDSSPLGTAWRTPPRCLGEGTVPACMMYE